MRDLTKDSHSFSLQVSGKRQAQEFMAETVSLASRHLLQVQTAPETVTQYCYPSNRCDISSLMDGRGGFVLQGEAGSDGSGWSVSSAGDINGDGLNDVLVSASAATFNGLANAGKSYVVFGSNQTNTWGSGVLDLSSLMDGHRGFVLQGEAVGDQSGYSVSSAGDINGDGLADILVGAPYAAPVNRTNAGKTYVVFGSKQANAWGSGILNLTSLMNGQRGFVLQGAAFGDQSGRSVSSAGDTNGDGLMDILVGASQASPPGLSYAGKTYVVFGSNQTTAWGLGILNLTSLMNGQRGFVLQGEAAFDASGSSVSNAGDVNGDGFDDVLVGAPSAKSDANSRAGKTYIVFGSNQTNAWGSGILNLTNLMNGQRGFVLQGEAANDYSGNSVSNAGDINGDGFDDVLVGASSAAPADNYNAGKSYVVFGSNQTNAWGSGILNLTSLMDGQRGFVLQGEVAQDQSGYSVSSAGDINEDGFDDVVVGASMADPASRIDAGRSYVVFGSNVNTAWGSGVLDLSTLMDGQRGFVLQGATGEHYGWSVSSVGDINGDGVDDVLVGAPPASPAGRSNAGKSYVLFGVPPTSLRFTANNLRLTAGETIRLNDSMLALVSDRVDTASLPLTVEMLEHGGFSAISAPNIALTRFYPQNVSNGIIQFVHDGTSLAPVYRLVTSNIKLARFYSDAQIDFLGSPPILINNQLFVDQGLASVLQSGDLSANDADGGLGNLQFILSNVQHGQFNHYNATGQLIAANISQFTQQSIFDRQIQFVHDGSSTAPSYEVAVTDSRSITNSRIAAITFNYAPNLNLSRIVVDQGQATTLRPQDISATDTETFDEDIIIEATNVTHGYFAYANNLDFSISAFRQFPLLTGTVQFIHDGSGSNASFSLRAFDGRIYTSWQTAPSQLNRRPVLQHNVSDVSVVQGESFGFDLGSSLFFDPDGEALNYSAQLVGGAPLPKGVEFIPPSRFEGNLPTLTNYQVEVQARDPRGLAASTDFDLQPKAPSQSSINLQTLYTSVSTVGGIIVGIAGYMWWRRKLSSHRRGFELANNLRKAANLEYYDFMRFDGDVYKSKIENLLSHVDGIEKGFYKSLPPAEKKSFAMCLAEILEQRQLLSPSGYGMGIYGWLLAFSVGWSQQLDFKKFEGQLDDIAKEALAAWRAEASPATRWPYFSPTCKDKAKAFCCARPSKAGMFARDKLRLSQTQSVSMIELKHQQTTDSPIAKESDAKISITETSSSPRLYGESKGASSHELASLIKQEMTSQLQPVTGQLQHISEGMQYLHQNMQTMAGNIKTVSDRMDRLEEGRPLLQGLGSSS